MLKEDFCLTLIGPDEFRPKPVGLEQALGELPQVKAAFERGHLLNPPLLPPKLILMTGVSGQGKSLFCKEAAEQLNLPLYRLELATLFSKWVGDSERNFARLFQVLESLSPCAVWIDEIEKALGGAREGSSQTHEVTGRVHGLILTWLQEHSSRILLMATCNEPQLLSSAVVNRADTKYFVGYQDPETLADTWMSNLDAIAKGHNVTRDELLELSQLKPSMTGREVFNRIKKARAVALARTPEGDRVDVTFADLKQVLRTYRTDFEKDTGRAMAILDMSKAYESASGKPIYYPDVEEREEQSPAAAGSKSKARLARDEV